MRSVVAKGNDGCRDRGVAVCLEASDDQSSGAGIALEAFGEGCSAAASDESTEALTPEKTTGGIAWITARRFK
jgi:hypothetical protein